MPQVRGPLRSTVGALSFFLTGVVGEDISEDNNEAVLTIRARGDRAASIIARNYMRVYWKIAAPRVISLVKTEDLESVAIYEARIPL